MPEPLPKLISSVIATAMSHPTRLGAMTILVQRNATPAQIAAELDESLSNVCYHIDKLQKLGCIELVSIDPAVGGRVVEHLYQAVDRVYFDKEAWERLGSKDKLAVVIALMRLVSEDVNEAMSHGTFFDPDDNHISRSPMNVDFEGWDETTALLDRIVDGLFEIQENVANRCKDGAIETFPIKVEIIQFRSPGTQSR
jgi:DNA-binding transcriptional ArsR family regulator